MGYYSNSDDRYERAVDREFNRLLAMYSDEELNDSRLWQRLEREADRVAYYDATGREV